MHIALSIARGTARMQSINDGEVVQIAVFKLRQRVQRVTALADSARSATNWRRPTTLAARAVEPRAAHAPCVAKEDTGAA